jgi:hypothetical protein
VLQACRRGQQLIAHLRRQRIVDVVRDTFQLAQQNIATLLQLV